MAKVRNRLPVQACPDGMDPDRLPIVSADHRYGGRGATLTAVIVDGDKAWFEEAALHGRTVLEQRVRWVNQRDAVPNGRVVNPVWVYVRPAGKGEFQYYGLVACEMLIDETNGVGYKYLADHVNRLSKAMEGAVDLSLLSDTGREALRKALAEYPQVLANSRPEVKEALGIPLDESAS